MVRALVEFGAEVDVCRRVVSWRGELVAEVVLEIVELADDFSDVGRNKVIHLRHSIRQRDVVGSTTVFQLKWWMFKYGTLEDVVAQVDDTFHFAKERNANDNVDCDIASSSDLQAACLTILRFVGKVELECCIKRG
jgi:uncharacterized protein (UPF0548 family)